MSTLLNIDQYGHKSVVPIYVGGHPSGTAFFIAKDRVLTAMHVIAEHIDDESVPVYIKVGDKNVVCNRLNSSSRPDVAILETKDFICPDEYVMPLVGGKFRPNIDLYVIGFPQELGNGEDYYAVAVRNSRKKDDVSKGFDRMVVRTDSFGFNSYNGFSGSPILNEFGKVVGVQTDQLFNTLAYASVNSFMGIINPYIDFKIEDDDAQYDNTPYGLATSIHHIEKAYEKIKTRYNKKIHIPVKTVERAIESFSGYGFNDAELEIYNEFKTWKSRLADVYLQHVNKIEEFTQYELNGQITKNFVNAVEELLNRHDSKSGSNYYLYGNNRNELSRIFSKLRRLDTDKYYFEKYNLMCIRGKAGCGKSHLIYSEAKKICQKSHVYLFLGSEFSAMESPLSTICRLMEWNDVNAIGELNDYLKNDHNRHATFIIDAINEGAGTRYWYEELPHLVDEFAKYKQLKLIVSVRTMNDMEEFQNAFQRGWMHVDVSGFEDIDNAIKNFFQTYEIHEDYLPYTKIEEFKNPLFVKIFCETYYKLTQEERQKALRIPIYSKYLQKRNEEVSIGVDEDPKQDITSKYIKWVAERSVEQYKCGDILRQQAFKRSRKLCYGRTWSNNILHICLNTNLLREYTSSLDGNDYVDFEYDSLGDYLKANYLDKRKCNESDRFRYLNLLVEILGDRDDTEHNKDKIFCFLRAFLSIWNPPAFIWNKPEFIKGPFTSILLSSLCYRNVRDVDNTLTDDIIEKILKENPDYIEPELILNNFVLYSKGLMDQVHRHLQEMIMCERDLYWSTKVNALYDGRLYGDLIEAISPVGKQEVWSLILLETWMLTASYPYVRYYIIRRLKQLLSENDEFIFSIIEAFSKVDDPYIHIGLYSAIYGAIVDTDNAKLACEVSELLKSIHYPEDRMAPDDIVVRFWTLKIFEYANHLDSKCKIWEEIQTPFKAKEDLFALLSSEKFGVENYFGESRGSKKIDHSLYHWDFSRYVVGTNSFGESNVFYEDEKNGVNLVKIENAIAYLIKHRYGWNEKLGEYDDTVPYHSGHDNPIERIGKKYQWLGLNQVYAYLSDTRKVKVDRWSHHERFIDNPYPWHVGGGSYFDPTLRNDDSLQNTILSIFDVIHPDSTMSLDRYEWLNNNAMMPPLFFEVKDKSGKPWVTLHAYSTIEEEDEDMKRERFVFYNGFVTDQKYFAKARKWGKSTNFYGRWMPEHTGSIEYKWNDYPWANSFISTEHDDEDIFTEGGMAFCLAYDAQLQEDTKGLPDDSMYLSTAYLPYAQMMREMKWHTAERGVIRDIEGNIVAINRHMPHEAMHALLVRKDLLDAYLNRNGLILFYALTGEKALRIGYSANIVRLTGAALYSSDNGIELIQPLRREPEPPKPKRSKVEDE